MSAPRTLYDKIWDSHVVEDRGDGWALLYVDRHVLDEHSSAQGFDMLRSSGRTVRRPSETLAVVDHNAPLPPPGTATADPGGLQQIAALAANCREFAIPFFPIGDPRQGISHVVAPEQGFVLPGSTVAAGDSHASTYGALAALGLGIGSSDIGHVLVSRTVLVRRAGTVKVSLVGQWQAGVSAKDLALALVARLGAAGATGCVLEYAGPALGQLSMEGRMTLANMAIEAGAGCGLIAVDELTLAWLAGRPLAPAGAYWQQARAAWAGLRADPGARYDRALTLDVGALEPQVSWGTSPQDVVPITASVPDPQTVSDLPRRRAMRRSLDYMGLQPGAALIGTPIDRVFIGSCTNGRLEDLRAAAGVLRGRRVAGNVRALAVPGSGLVKRAAEAEGIDQVLRQAGFEWRQPGCSMCLAMNHDRLEPGERCASTSNRNFEGRQGPGGRTHLMSPAMAAAAAIAGAIVDVRALPP